jgi:DNA (cytosine-5)-methyltransferase 1
MSKLAVGSLFSGIGGIDLGLQRAGFEIKWQVEIDEYCQKVLGKHWPDVARHGDIRTVGKHNLEAVDLIAGGFPCQDISNAGKQVGITGERSGLWSEFHRLICELRPRFVLVENVAALLARGIDRVLGDLSKSGYDAEWQVLPASAFGAPHLRERVFIVAYSNGRNGNRWSKSSERRSDGATMGCIALAYTSSERLQGRRQERELSSPSPESPAIFKRRSGTRITRSDWWTVEPSMGRVAHGIPARVDRLKGLGNAVVPQIAEYIGRCILNAVEIDQEVSA